MDERREVFQGRARHLLRELQQIRLDAEHWNRVHSAEAPIDPDPHGELAACEAWLRTVLGDPEEG